MVEKQPTPERDFRGETIAAPSAVTLRKLGFGPALREHGYLETTGVTMRMEGRDVFRVDYGRFPVGTLPIDIPQPALISLFHQAAAHLPSHTYAPSTTVTGLIEHDGRICGAVLKRKDGERLEVRARLTVGADGRSPRSARPPGSPPTSAPWSATSCPSSCRAPPTGATTRSSSSTAPATWSSCPPSPTCSASATTCPNADWAPCARTA